MGDLFCLMKDAQKILDEVENFLNFQVEHTKRHRLDKFVMTVDKANYLLGKIQEVTKYPKGEAQSRQESYNAWFTNEIEQLKQQVASLNEALRARG
jgi:uncharacterized protein YpuA (DUF1002 family)